MNAPTSGTVKLHDARPFPAVTPLHDWPSTLKPIVAPVTGAFGLTEMSDRFANRVTGLPANALKRIELVTSHAALLIASPEYNSMITPLLKNTIDWCTRAEENPFAGKVAAILSASPGALGGVRSLKLAQQLMLHLGCHVVPGQVFLPQADKAFDERGAMKEPRPQKSVPALVTELVRLTRVLG